MLRTSFCCYLQPILQLGDDWALGDEGEDRALHLEGQWDNEEHEDGHLEDEKSEDLWLPQSACFIAGTESACSTGA